MAKRHVELKSRFSFQVHSSARSQHNEREVQCLHKQILQSRETNNPVAPPSPPPKAEFDRSKNVALYCPFKASNLCDPKGRLIPGANEQHVYLFTVTSTQASLRSTVSRRQEQRDDPGHPAQNNFSRGLGFVSTRQVLSSGLLAGKTEDQREDERCVHAEKRLGFKKPKPPGKQGRRTVPRELSECQAGQTNTRSSPPP